MVAGIKNNLLERGIEALAVLCSLTYTVLYQLGNIWCWAFAASGAVLFVYLCFRRNILAESALQLFYVGMAIYGYTHWNDAWQTLHWPLSSHLLWIGGALGALFLTWQFLQRFTTSAMPLVDAFTTVFSIVATWIMVNYVHENWLYWIVIDAVSVYLYFQRKMYFGAGLFVLYTLLSIGGYFHWLEQLTA
ncbi:MAG: nicotinamide riboside transporter PnuC [Bacteroidota bacterium]